MVPWKARLETRDEHKNGPPLARTSPQISEYHTLGGCELLCPKGTHLSIKQTSILWKQVSKNHFRSIPQKYASHNGRNHGKAMRCVSISKYAKKKSENELVNKIVRRKLQPHSFRALYSLSCCHRGAKMSGK
jgi:hypothetical protein